MKRQVESVLYTVQCTYIVFNYEELYADYKNVYFSARNAQQAFFYILFYPLMFFIAFFSQGNLHFFN